MLRDKLKNAARITGPLDESVKLTLHRDEEGQNVKRMTFSTIASDKGCSLPWRLVRRNIVKKRLISFAFKKTPRISLNCKLVPVQYREYKNGQLTCVLHIMEDGVDSNSSRTGCN